MASVPSEVGETRAEPSGRFALSLSRYRLRFEARDRLAFQAQSGSAWRGVLGHALRYTVCVTRAPSCDGCLLRPSCVYPAVFETPPPPGSGKMRRYKAVPHPYVLQTDSTNNRAFAAGDEVELGLVLIGRANAHLPYLVHALSRAGERGLGRNRARLELREVLQETGSGSIPIYTPGSALAALPAAAPEIPPAPEAARIIVHTPLRLKREEHLVRPEDFRFADLFAPLLRRISMLSYFHTDTPLETDFGALTQAARAVCSIRPALRWKEWTRYSTRQETAMQMGGLLGEIVLEPADWSAFWPYLWLGQWVHAGKAATMGLGRYTIEPRQACDPGKVAAPHSCSAS